MKDRLTQFAIFVALSLCLAVPAHAATIPFDVRTVQSAGTAIQNVTDAQKLLDGSIAGTTVFTGQSAVLNFNNPASPSGGIFAGDTQFPGISSSNEKDFALQATGSIEIPTAGSYTFGVSSDDGFVLTVGSNTLQYANTRKPAQTTSTFTFAQAGTYPVNLVYFQHHASAELELFASSAVLDPGNDSNQGSGILRLINDTANGGLSLISPGVNLPEPSAFILFIPAIGLTLTRRRQQDESAR